jgi:hypothetical protein
MNAEKPLAAGGYDLMGTAFEVHGTLGGGLLEGIYQESMEAAHSLGISLLLAFISANQRLLLRALVHDPLHGK